MKRMFPALASTLSLSLALAAPWALAQTPQVPAPAAAAAAPSDDGAMQALRAAAAADKKGLVARTLDLSDAEAKKFWPIYEAYQRARDAADRRRALAFESVLTRDKPITDAYAKTLSVELMGADDDELRARKRMHNKLMRALPAKKAAQYLQLESKLRASQAFDIASAMPAIR